MNKFLIIVATFLALFSCKKAVDKLLTFSFNNSTSFTIPGTALPNVPVISPADVTTNSQQEMESNHTDKDKVKNVKLTALNLSIVRPTDGDFNFIKSIEIFINAEGLEEKLIAWKIPVPADAGALLVLETTNDALDDYVIKRDKYTLRNKVVLKSSPKEETEIKADMTFQVTADPL